MFDLDDAMKIFEDSPEHVFRVSRASWPHDEVFEVFAFTDASRSHLASLVQRANFVMLREHFESREWDFVVQSDGFCVRCDAPEEVLVFMAECVLALSNYPLLDESTYSELVLEEVEDYLGYLVSDVAYELDVEDYDVEEYVREFVLENFEHDGFQVIVPNEGELVDLVRGKFNVSHE